MKKLLLSAMLLLNSSVTGMQCESPIRDYINTNNVQAVCNSHNLPGKFVSKIASYLEAKDLPSATLFDQNAYEALSEELQYSIAIEACLYSFESGQERPYTLIRALRKNKDLGALITEQSIVGFIQKNSILKELLKDPSLIYFVGECMKRFFVDKDGLTYTVDHADKKQSLRFFPMQLIEFGKYIQKFHVSNQQFTTIPGAIGQLTQLTHLDLSKNRLNNFPESIACLTRLQSLNLSYNDFVLLPGGIFKLINLKILDASHNHINAISSYIERLTQLESIDFSHNNLTCLPDSMENVHNLQYINISGNKFEHIPAFIS